MGQVLKQVSKISGVYGQPGEERVSQILAEQLSDEYIILNSPRLYYHGGTFDIDHVVIGPNGVFVIETKNMQGAIIGGIMGNWVQERKRSGKHRKVKIGNPANQVNQYGKVVKSYVGSRIAYETGKKINLKTYSIVVFIHDEVDLSSMDFTKPGYIGRVKVIKSDQLVDFITKREGIKYSEEEIREISETLVPVNQRDQTSYFSLEELKNFTESKASRYELFEELGRGSFGVVMRGFDYKLDKEIAIKKLPVQKQNDTNSVNRFYREAQIASGLNHDNIVGVYDYYEKDGEYYIVMELVEGETLEDYANSREISLDESLRIVKEVCSALTYAHENGVIHRDLKPSNILLAIDGKVKVTDFGIAKLVSSTDLTLDDSGAGTPTSMSPEQITGKNITEKTDIFSIGILLYFLTTGKLPFEGEHIGEIVHKITRLDPVPPRQLNNQISPDLEGVILKALEKNPDDRFESVTLLMQAIDELLTSGRLSQKINNKGWLKYVPAFIRPMFKLQRQLFSTLTIVSLFVFLAILGFQGYRDSRELSREEFLTKQYGFTNDNIELVYTDPKLYFGMPVNLVGRLDKMIKINGDSTQFSVVVQTEGQPKYRSIVVSYDQPHFNLQFSSFIKITGSIQNMGVTQNNQSTPMIVADKVESITDPWSMLAPPQFTVFPNKSVNQSDRVVLLEKIEFAELETRLYVKILNKGDSEQIVVLANNVGKQEGQEYRELRNGYGISYPEAFQLQPGQEAREVVFLEPLDRRKHSATFVLGSSNDILMGQQPYVFDIQW